MDCIQRWCVGRAPTGSQQCWLLSAAALLLLLLPPPPPPPRCGCCCTAVAAVLFVLQSCCSCCTYCRYRQRCSSPSQILPIITSKLRRVLASLPPGTKHDTHVRCATRTGRWPKWSPWTTQWRTHRRPSEPTPPPLHASLIRLVHKPPTTNHDLLPVHFVASAQIAATTNLYSSILAFKSHVCEMRRAASASRVLCFSCGKAVALQYP